LVVVFSGNNFETDTFIMAFFEIYYGHTEWVLNFVQIGMSYLQKLCRHKETARCSVFFLRPIILWLLCGSAHERSRPL